MAERGRNGRFQRAETPSRGRPPKRTPAVEKAIIRDIERAVARWDAAQCAGVNRRTLNRWIEEDPEFGELLEFAESRAKRDLTAQVHLGGLGWQAAMTLMERRWPDQYGQKSRLDIGVETVDYIEEKARKIKRPVADVIARAEALGMSLAPTGTHS